MSLDGVKRSKLS